ncbi:MAG: hypothetical protein H7Z37_04265 [Pyrinomonadaceae bacterium]|nr:hypothetical protein [Pyrinomonadaceae bacterium]
MIKKFRFDFCVFIFCCLICFAETKAQDAVRSECFPFEKLSAGERKKAEDLLLKALDGEALFTIAGGLKPMSSGFASFQVRVALPRQSDDEAEKIRKSFESKKPEELKDDEKAKLNAATQTLERRDSLQKIDETRRILQTFRCGGQDEIFADVEHFAKIFDGKRYLEAIVFSRPRLRRMLAEKNDFFSRWGITENAEPLQVLYAVETDETKARFGGYGYLFGYPDYAVRFFVEAATEEDLTGKFVERSFYSIPTFANETNNFVYAVSKTHTENETDRNLKQKAAAILAEYKRRRAEYIGANKKGVIEMMRDWFCATSDGKCSPNRINL